ncbi:MAG: hypothetical protein A3B25_00175 [Candidatus Ryanbacteria bacterium RIFCSPLOWO2_01_FULL_48_26]|uniref:Glycosyl transferase family 1 domain-containing protein n=1 Tax=Candidatus Ryanbacteria bacterium RIFCSPLOWO2_01_FULL_48_26 TaxID=1802126 RepID=A0A1G2GSV0_9BACT|nr:MAG: hypothetical protein A3B25_00175 [Candidatus Ryanbacteria bacterium RIFCSPLOWO2_01_FULL_48_26]
MRLIFVTRKIHRGDPLTGFIFGWLNALAQDLDVLYVICQEKGNTSGLAQNIEVHSFGKEKGYGKFRQGFSLFALSFSLAKKSDGFFIHMHPIYAIVSWLPAKVFGKKIVLWYTHKSVDLKLRVAHALIDTVLTASKESFRLPSKKVKIVGHGIDMRKFKPSSHIPHSIFHILSLGRISPVKDYETLIKAVEILVKDRGIKDLKVEIYGRIGLPEHQAYLDSLVGFVQNANLDEVVDFQSEVSHEYVPQILSEADLFVNLSQTGSIDKAVLEAAACGVVVLTSNEAFEKPLKAISPHLFFERNNPRDLVKKILELKNLAGEERSKLAGELRNWVEREHNLNNLVNLIVAEFK